MLPPVTTALVTTLADIPSSVHPPLGSPPAGRGSLPSAVTREAGGTDLSRCHWQGAVSGAVRRSP